MPLRPKPDQPSRPRKDVCPSDIIDDDDLEDITGLADPPPGVCPSSIVDEDEDSGWGGGRRFLIHDHASDAHRHRSRAFFHAFNLGSATILA